jgi:hypothetical protein
MPVEGDVGDLVVGRCKGLSQHQLAAADVAALGKQVQGKQIHQPDSIPAPTGTTA